MSNTKPLVTLLVTMIIGFLSIGIVGYHTLKDSLIESKKQDVATMLNIARTQTSVYIDQYQQGILTKEQTEDKVIEFLSSLRYEAAYVWANDNNGIARVHPRQEILGQFQSSYTHHIANLTDSSIFYLTKTNIKPVRNQLVIKTNGVIRIPEWDWVVGFGLYMDDVNGAIIDSSTAFLTAILLSMLVAFLMTYYWLSKSKQQ